MIKTITETNEQWKQIKGFSSYEVSTLGRVRTIDRTIMTKKGPRKLPGHLLKPNPVDKRWNYVQVNLKVADNQWKPFLVHKLVMATFNPLNESASDQKMEIDHINSVKNDNRLCNLRYLTHADNLRQEHRMKLIRKAVKALDEKGNVIRVAESIRAMAKAMGLSECTVGNSARHNRPTIDHIQFKFVA